MKHNFPTFAPQIALDIGSGSGIISAFIATLFPSVFSLAIDISPVAVDTSTETLLANKVSCTSDCILMDMRVCGFCDQTFDLIVFNPPYVATTPEEESQGPNLEGVLIDDGPTKLLCKAWAGGDFGVAVINRIVEIVPRLLRNNGLFLLLLIDYNDPEKIIDDFLSKNGQLLWQARVSSIKLVSASLQLICMLDFTFTKGWH